jgi:hypothetical protein
MLGTTTTWRIIAALSLPVTLKLNSYLRNTLHKSIVHHGKDLAFIEGHHGKSGTFCYFLKSYHHFLLQRLAS